MAKFALPPGAKQIEMQDGTRLRGKGTAKGGRIVETQTLDHTRAIQRNAIEGGHMIRVPDFAGAGTPDAGKECSKGCIGERWSWNTECPKCGAELVEVAS